MVAVAVLGAGVVGAGASIYGSQAAAGAQTDAANSANALQQGMFDTTQQNLQPFIQGGQQGLNMLTDQIGGISQAPTYTPYAVPGATTFNPVKMDQATLEQTPGYQFNLTQGLKSVQNSAAARGLGASGAALKGAATYATGLADSTYQNQFNNALQNEQARVSTQLASNQQMYGAGSNNAQQSFTDALAGKQNSLAALLGLTNVGQASAAGLGNTSASVGNSMANATIGAGNAQGAADVSSGNAITSGLNSGVNNYLTSQLYAGLLNKNSGQSGSPSIGYSN